MYCMELISFEAFRRMQLTHFQATCTSAYYLLELPIKSIELILLYRLGSTSSVKAHIDSNRNTNILLT